jgi:farnesol dehydrogenase
MITAVTGSTGFIGQNLVRRLLEAGEKLRLLLRRPGLPEGLTGQPLETVLVDFSDRLSLEEALKDCQRIYHLAAYARSWARNPDVFYRANVEALKNLLSACLRAGVNRVVQVSSCVVSGPSKDQPVTESQGRSTPHYFTDYEASKAQAEALIPDFLSQGLEVVIARPTRVYGPGPLTEANSVTRIIRYYLKLRLAPMLNDGQQIGNYVYVDDVVDGLKLLMDRGRSGEAYLLGGENITLAGFYDRLFEVSGRRALKLKIPGSLALKLARLEATKARLFRIPPFITESWVRTFLENWAFSHEKATRELGYQPRDLKEGLRQTCLWLGYSL